MEVRLEKFGAKVDERFEKFEAKIDAKFEKIEARFDKIEQQLSQLIQLAKAKT